MSEREVLINEIKGLPDFMIGQLQGIVRYVKLGIETTRILRSRLVTIISFTIPSIQLRHMPHDFSNRPKDLMAWCVRIRPK